MERAHPAIPRRALALGTSRTLFAPLQPQGGGGDKQEESEWARYRSCVAADESGGDRRETGRPLFAVCLGRNGLGLCGRPHLPPVTRRTNPAGVPSASWKRPLVHASLPAPAPGPATWAHAARQSAKEAGLLRESAPEGRARGGERTPRKGGGEVANPAVAAPACNLRGTQGRALQARALRQGSVRFRGEPHRSSSSELTVRVLLVGSVRETRCWTEVPRRLLSSTASRRIWLAASEASPVVEGKSIRQKPWPLRKQGNREWGGRRATRWVQGAGAQTHRSFSPATASPACAQRAQSREAGCSRALVWRPEAIPPSHRLLLFRTRVEDDNERLREQTGREAGVGAVSH